MDGDTEAKAIKEHQAPPDSDRVKLARIQAWQSVLTSVVRAAGVVGVFLFVFKSAEVLAGKETGLKAVLQGLIDVRASEWAAWLLAGGSTIGYARERRLRKRTIEGTSAHVTALEKKKDPGRSSSGLTKQGTVPKPRGKK